MSEMRQFALQCFRWADEADDVSHRDLIICVAKTLGVGAPCGHK